MDATFLGKIVKAYLKEHNIYSQFEQKDMPSIKNKIITELSDAILELREYDYELYEQLYNRSHGYQADIIKSYLNYTFQPDNELYESIEMIIGATLTGIISLLYSNKVSGFIMRQIHHIGEGFESVGKFLVKRGRYFKFRYAIVNKNAKECYAACGVDPKQLSGTTYLNIGDGGIGIGSKSTLDAAECLSDCYVGHAIESINLLMQGYFVCLRNTGEYHQVSNANPDDLMKVVTGLELGNSCHEYYEMTKEAFDNFNSLLDFLYKTNYSKKQKAMRQLKTTLIKAKKTVERSSPNQFR